MDSGEIDLCCFCSDLITAAAVEASSSSSHPHHPTYGSLSASGTTCSLCLFIASLWPHFDSRLRRHGVSDEALENSRGGFPVEVRVSEARQMASGASWAFLQAWLRSTGTPLQAMSHFTIVVDPRNGKIPRFRFMLQCLHLLNRPGVIIPSVQHPLGGF